MSIKIALAGNPNSGKTTLFNQLTGSQQYVGNWPGVTVEKKEGHIKGHKDVVLLDLPGIYSLSPYTLEEVVSRKYLIEEKPDAIINIVDATNIERNLYLTTQILELGIPTVIALNMMDIVHKEGDQIDVDKLSENLGCPIMQVSALKNIGANELAKFAIKLAKDKKPVKPIHKFEDKVEAAVSEIENEIQSYVDEDSIRWFAVKLFERDEKVLSDTKIPKSSLDKIEQIVSELESDFDDDSASIIINERYYFIDEAIKGNLDKKNKTHLNRSDKIDKVVTNKWLAIPIFVVIMFLVYYISIATVGTGLTDTVNDFFETTVPTFLTAKFEVWNVAPWLSSLILDGVVGGVGAVLGFLPQMMVLFFLLAILEDSGYMARIAFIMDKLFRRFGLSGKSFIPMIVSTGCGVPAIMASRTIESDRDRKMTIMTTTFVPCSAKLTIIALIAGAMFGESWWVAPSIYFLGIGAIVISGIILKKTKLFQGDPSPFVMELPQYRFPSIKSLALHMWEKAKSFVIRAGSVIFISSCIIWFLSNFSWRMQMVDTNDSMLAIIGGAIAPIFKPLGWGDWRASVASISGLVAKENIVGTFGVLFGNAEVSEAGNEIWGSLAQIMTPLAGYSFLAFNMLCAPCFAAIGAIKKEVGAKWMWITIGYQTLLAYVVALLIYQIGLFISTGAFGIGTIVAFIIAVIGLYLLFRPMPKKHDKDKKQENPAVLQS